MSVKIRLKRTGRKKDPHYRIVAVDSKKKRDGRVLEYIGHYHPQDKFPNLDVNLERYSYFKSTGAQVTDTVRTLVNKLKRSDNGGFEEKDSEAARKDSTEPVVGQNEDVLNVSKDPALTEADGEKKSSAPADEIVSGKEILEDDKKETESKNQNKDKNEMLNEGSEEKSSEEVSGEKKKSEIQTSQSVEEDS